MQHMQCIPREKAQRAVACGTSRLLEPTKRRHTHINYYIISLLQSIRNAAIMPSTHYSGMHSALGQTRLTLFRFTQASWSTTTIRAWAWLT